MDTDIKEAFYKLINYCEKESYKGFDPYDGLNSSFFQSIPIFSKSSIIRLIWIQAFKRSPVNIRELVGIKKEYNPKALGLFLSGYCNLYKKKRENKYLEKILFFSKKLIELRSKNYSGSCWGYNFDWQARAFYQPKYTPTVVATSFIGNAFLDAFEIVGEKYLFETARSACDFILNDLNRTYDSKGNFAFSYSPMDNSVVYNATLLASRLLSRVFSFTREPLLIEEARKSVAFCCSFQKKNGAWTYGSLSFHQWIDSFHTGYNLESIADYMKYSEDYSFKNNLEKGCNYYIQNFFTKEGIPKYFNNAIYPIDIHAPAQMVITISKLNKFQEQKELIDKVLNWTIENMQSSEGYFYYQINKFYKSKIPYMRWAQAWMFYALSEYLMKTNNSL